MKAINRILIFIVLISVILIPTTASASGFMDDKVIFGGNFTLASGETLDGDLVVFGGNIVLKESSSVNGDVVVMGGNVILNGTINGNLVSLGGMVELQQFARINGDLTVLGGSFEQADGAHITGNIVTEENIPFKFTRPDKFGLFNGDFSALRFQQLPFVSASWFFFRILIWTGLAILIALFIQDQAAVINRAAFGEPVMSILAGMGVIIVAPLVLIALIVTILLSPVSLIGIFALIAAWVVGLVAASIEVGKKLAESLNQSWPIPILAGVGMFILSLFFNGFSQLVPCVGWLPRFVLGTWVMGAVILTRFGSREYPESDGIDTPPLEDLPPPFESEETPVKVAVSSTKAAAELAQQEGLDLGTVKGTGAEGKITINDVRKALKG
ncbi:MAG: polymer-forming cytoskeletal protein [Anaerolineales bacterium]